VASLVRTEDTLSSSGNKVAIVGVGETEYVRRSEKDIKTLIMEAIIAAIDDAGISPDEIDGIVSEASIVPAIMPGDEVAANLGLAETRLAATIGCAGAGVVGAILLGVQAIASGLCNTVLSYFGVNWGSDPAGPYGFHGKDMYKASLEMPFAFYGQPVYFAAIARRYMHEFGLTTDHLGSLAVATRAWASLNPTAMKREPITLEDYYRSPLIADPLRVLDCCLITDGAAAFIMTSAGRARGCRRRPVYVAGAAYSQGRYSGHSSLTQREDLLFTQAQVSGPRAMAMAGVTPRDVDFLEVYACFTITALMQIEDLGFCGTGEAGPLVAEGRTAPGGQLPVNTHGGLLSHAYVLGINHVVEAVYQLRGEAGARQVPDARVGVVAGSGAWDHATVVLTR